LNRNRLIAGIVAFLLVVLVGAGVWWFVRAIDQSRHMNQRPMVVRLGYCDAEETRPCIASFSQGVRDKMLVEILTPSSRFPNFYLTISKEGEAYLYDCKKVGTSRTRVHCVGQQMQPGESLQFTIISTEDNIVLAEGSFAIIGLLLVAPGIEVAEAIPATESPTPFLAQAPTVVVRTPTPAATATIPSYPNPSYPNPTSYPNPSYSNP
jgi:hypothetical protein